MKLRKIKYSLCRLLPLLIMLLCGINSFGEILEPVKWQFTAKKTATNEYDLIFTAKIDDPWHIFSQFSDESNDAQSALKFSFKPGAYTAVGKVRELSSVITEFDKEDKHDVKFFKVVALFSQHVKLTGDISSITGVLNFQTCKDGMCLPPTDVDFKFDVKTASVKVVPVDANKTVPAANIAAPAQDHVADAKDPKDTLQTTPKDKSVTDVKIKQGTLKPASTVSNGSVLKLTLWQIFIAGLLSGFVALLTPCVFPMIPLTVSFFTKKKNDKADGVRKAILFGLSIIVIYVGLGLLITVIFGANTLNSISSNPYVNIGFFVVFLIFAISFLGAFEINLPSSWTNSSDKLSEKNGFVGIFFMAATLALVSFSCTGPVVGQLLVLTSNGGYIGPIVGMTGFALAMALPFTIFAAFPTLLHNLPRSGGWLNSVKVTLGFVELALALKFLSAADLINDWGLLKREYFLALWIVIFFLLGLYLLGKLKFSHDSDTPHISVTRLLLAIISFAFTVYMIPGLWGAPVNILSGIAPPNEYNEGAWLNGSKSEAKETPTGNGKTKKYAEYFKDKTPLGLDCYYDYKEALEEARRVKKPLMIDFTGIVCTNCRKMENTVWAQPEVLRRLKEDVVLVSLYMDDKHKLDSSEIYVNKKGKKITSIGDKWNDFAATAYNSNSEPYYVLIDQNEKLLVTPMGYDPHADLFAAFLDNAKEEYKKRQ